MQRLQRISGPALLAVLVLFGSAATAAAQDNKAVQGKAVKFTTADQVEIEGTFYQATQAKSRTIILLHPYGEHSRKPQWVSLAKALNAAGYAVLAFDFRGHGESTHIKEPGTGGTGKIGVIKGFWDEQENQIGVKGLVVGKPRPTEIDVKQFAPSYMRVLVNDIAAAKNFLDQRHDDGECNSGDIILIGAKEGAALGAVWMNSEWQRYKYIPAAPGAKATLDFENPEGKAITCAVWLSMIPVSLTSAAATQTINPEKTLEIPGKLRKVPMAFFYGDGDDKGHKAATLCEKMLKGNNKEAYPYTGAVKLEGANGAAGIALLSKDLNTEQRIVNYLKLALEDVPIRRKTGTTQDSYYWQLPINGKMQPVPARIAGKANVAFASYKYFIR
jgi:pimeloyl-ACP methyl ester carboxylesterase